MKKIFLYITALALFVSCQIGGSEPETPVVHDGKQPSLTERSSKRGVCFDFKDVSDVFLLANTASWSYNWGEMEDSLSAYCLDMKGMDYIPMAWNANFNEAKLRSWKITHPQCKYLLAFNEPNLTDQARMTPAEAAAAWPRLKALADELNMKIVAPAMNYGTLPGYSDPVMWLDEFFALVPKSDVCALSLHCYMGTPSAVKGFVDRFDKYGLPIWMTEFCGWEQQINSEEAQMGYMCSVVTFFEADPRVERYAWFMPRTSGKVENYPYMQLLTHEIPAELTPMGEIYQALPCADKPRVQLAELPTNLNLFTSSMATEAARNKTFMEACQFRVSTDTQHPSSNMMLKSFSGDQWLEYKVDAIEDLTMLHVRYWASTDAFLQVQIDDNKPYIVSLPKSTTWAEQVQALTLPCGRHSIRLSMFGGYCDLSTLWWSK